MSSSYSSTFNPQVQHATLITRINEKRNELENLKALQGFSRDLANNLDRLAEKLNTLADGTEAVAEVMANWDSVLRAIYMASAVLSKPKSDALPQTLVRVATEPPHGATNTDS
ncbi:MAG: hypothetical protein M1829_000581 [Trizodia sp. TS-e1964]|nr:MAG: hypothetical protein M1829_000581 [Trizodia sp. TS-e1964]